MVDLFHCGIVIRAAGSAHGRRYPKFIKHMAITSAAVLRAAIRMENQAILQTSVRHGISKGVLHKFRVYHLALTTHGYAIVDLSARK